MHSNVKTQHGQPNGIQAKTQTKTPTWLNGLPLKPKLPTEIPS